MLHLFAFILGAVSAPLMPKTLLGPPVWFLVPALSAFLGYLFFRRARTRKVSVILQTLLASCWVCVGLVVTGTAVDRLVAAQVPEDWHGQDVTLYGRVTEVVDQTDSFTRFHLRVEHGDTAEVTKTLQGRDLRLSWYYGPAVGVEERWALTVRLKRPRGFVNPRGFDYAAWLLAQDIVATGYVTLGKRFSAELQPQALTEVRLLLSERLFDGDVEASPFFRALLLGDKNGLSSEQWRVLQRTGTIHLMAISGLHVGLVAILGLMLGWSVARSVALLPGCRSALWPSRVIPPFTSCVLAAGYSALAGFSIPTQRAMVVVALANLALLAGLRARPVHLLLLACVTVLVLSPMASTQSGFWLSFIAVFALITGFAGRTARRHPVLVLIKAQALLALGLLAPLLALGTATSLVGPAANVVAVPVVSLFVVPGLLLAASIVSLLPVVAESMVRLLDGLFSLLWHYLSALASVDWAQWWPGVPTGSGMVAAVAGGCLLLLLPRGLYLRPLGVVVLALSLMAPRAAPAFAQLTILEVGQGLAVWFRAGEYDLLYDTGPAFSDDFDAGSRIVVPFLQGQGVKALDRLVVSHGDGDHSGGLEGVLRNMPVNELSSGSPQIAGRYPGAKQCLRGQHWRSDGISFQILWPPTDDRLASNDQSCVLLIEWEAQSILLTGDVGIDVERRLLRDSRLPRNVSVLVAGHHGSKTSSSAAFVDHLNPQAVVFSAGYQNRYGHPHRNVVERFRERGARLFNTGEDGAISFQWLKATDTTPNEEKAREQIDRAWY